MQYVEQELAPEYREPILSSMLEVKHRLDAATLLRLIERGDARAVIDLIFGSGMTWLARVVEQLPTAAGMAAQYLEADLTLLMPGGHRAMLTVGAPPTPEVLDAVTRRSLAMIREVDRSSREAIAEYLKRDLRAGVNPRQTARSIREVIGLTAQQAVAVQNYRRALESGSLSALARELRDRRYDRTVLRWKTGQPVDLSKVDEMVKAYERRMLDYRATVIARTQAMQALHDGQRAIWEQAILDGRADITRVRRYWFTAKDERTCVVCAGIPAMNPRGVGIHQPFVLPDGQLLLDPVAHPQCRCTVMWWPEPKE